MSNFERAIAIIEMVYYSIAGFLLFVVMFITSPIWIVPYLIHRGLK